MFALSVGAVVSTVIDELVFVTAAFHAPSFTVFAGSVNVTVPFTLLFAVYVKVYVLLVALHHTVAFPNVTYALLRVIELHAKLLVDTHTASVHVSTIVHCAHAFNGVADGFHHVHTGAVTSAAFAVSFTALSGIVNVYFFVVVL